MTYAELDNPSGRVLETGLETGKWGDAAIALRRWTWRSPGRRTNWLLLILFVDLQLADVMSTNYALAVPGIVEGNPLMALSQAKFGAAWCLPKLAVAALVAALVPWSRRCWPVICMVAISGGAVLINLAHL